MTRICLSCAIVALLATVLPAAEVLPKNDVDRIVAPLIDGQWCQGMVVALVRIDDTGKPQTQFIRYGRTSADDVAPPDESSLFEIGSITKAFTGVLLAVADARGEVALDDPVQKHLPNAVKMPHFGDDQVTLLHLATHRSGIPTLPANFDPAGDNPYADYTAERLYAYLNNYKLMRKPGEEHEYSNAAVGLLGHVLARRAGKTYEEMVVERIASPLRMGDTRIALSDEQRTRLVSGHDADGNRIVNWDFDVLAGAGALRSTAADMAKFVAANLAPPKGELGEALQVARQIHADDEPVAMGLGWHITKTTNTVWHNGQTGAYHSFVGFLPDQKFGVVLLANTATMHVDQVGDGLLRLLLGLSAEPPKLRKPIQLEAEELERFVGKYRMSLLFSLTITREEDQLFCQATGQEKFRIYPESETKFFWKVVDAQVTFDNDDAGKVTGLTLHQNGKDATAKRVE
jgi:D-alanyl-D-alanine-carboxypeptidase/D-alanyl-D-alanine-endopeptidase